VTPDQLHWKAKAERFEKSGHFRMASLCHANASSPGRATQAREDAKVLLPAVKRAKAKFEMERRDDPAN
jgi:hypothetical protein